MLFRIRKQIKRIFVINENYSRKFKLMKQNIKRFSNVKLVLIHNFFFLSIYFYASLTHLKAQIGLDILPIFAIPVRCTVDMINIDI